MDMEEDSPITKAKAKVEDTTTAKAKVKAKAKTGLRAMGVGDPEGADHQAYTSRAYTGIAAA